MATNELQMYYKVLDDLQDVTTEKGLVSTYNVEGEIQRALAPKAI